MPGMNWTRPTKPNWNGLRVSSFPSELPHAIWVHWGGRSRRKTDHTQIVQLFDETAERSVPEHAW